GKKEKEKTARRVEKKARRKKQKTKRGSVNREGKTGHRNRDVRQAFTYMSLTDCFAGHIIAKILAKYQQLPTTQSEAFVLSTFPTMAAIIGESPKLALYSYWQSSCSWRVRFALNLKGISYEYKAVNLSKGEQFTPEFEKLNPLHFVPVLVDGDVVVSDSYAILLYLEEKYPQRALLPADPQLKALNLQVSILEYGFTLMIRTLYHPQVASIVTSSIQPLHMLSTLVYSVFYIYTHI
ncbi:hypothetical protein Gogos_021323, partial [Gossypium gossypioides]|nr:hypothetical protein [Gossypium gossypioides]